MATGQVGIKDTGSNYNFFDKEIKAKVSRSLFDLSYLNSGTCEVGMLVPTYLEETVPGDDFTLNVEALLRAVNPPLVPLLSRLRVFFHAYWSSFDSLWKGASQFFTKGRSGNYVLSVPQVVLAASGAARKDTSSTSLAHHLGMMFAQSFDPNGNVATGFSLLPFMMYQRIYRDYYMNQTLHNAASGDGQDLGWFPLDDDDFRLEVDFNLKNLSGDTWPDVNGCTLSKVSVGNSDMLKTVNLGDWRFRNWPDDYYTSCMPWPQRGDEAGVSFSGSLPELLDMPVYIKNPSGNNIDMQISGWLSPDNNKFSNLLSRFYPGGNPSDYSMANVGFIFDSRHPSGSAAESFMFGPMESADAGSLVDLGSAPGNPTSFSLYSRLNKSVSFESSLTLSALRELNATQRMMEKMARVDGSYGSFCRTFFGETPPSAKSNKPIYIGGCYQSIKISEVLQTGGTTDTSDQGEQTGHAMSYGDGFIGRFHAPDYGYIMILMSIVPDSMYFQGVNRRFTRLLQEDFYLPERAGLSPQAVLNKEIFFTGSNLSQDNDLFGFQDRYDEMRFRSNEVHGKVADPTNKSFFPYTQARYFTELPTLSEEFCAMGSATGADITLNVRKDWLTSQTEVPFIWHVANKIRAVRPLPYRARPAELFNTGV